MINWTHVISTYLPHLFVIGIGVLVALIFHQVISELMTAQNLTKLTPTPDTIITILYSIKDLLIRQVQAIMNLRKEALFSPAVETTFVVLLIMAWIVRMDNPVYLLAFSTFKAPDSWKVSHKQIIEIMRDQKCYTDESLDFMDRLLVRSGTGQNTAWPPGIVQCLDGKPSDKSIEGSRTEARTIIFNNVENALKKANLSPKDIDVQCLYLS